MSETVAAIPEPASLSSVGAQPPPLPEKRTVPNLLKVSAKSSPNAVAGALAAALREREGIEMQAVGAGAINQAIKAVAIARSYLKAGNMDLQCTPSFIDVEIGGKARTGISLAITRRAA